MKQTPKRKTEQRKISKQTRTFIVGLLHIYKYDNKEEGQRDRGEGRNKERDQMRVVRRRSEKNSFRLFVLQW